ncbi:MAG: hypothetical protein ACYS0G_08590 [Planctomycetota bacterium]|jgi:uncharacterized membrane protein
MNDSKPKRVPSVGDAAWAHNRWPAIGLNVGAGFGVAAGVIFWAGWFWTIILVVLLAFAGCFTGVVAAKLVYRRVDEGIEKQEEAD